MGYLQVKLFVKPTSRYPYEKINQYFINYCNKLQINKEDYVIGDLFNSRENELWAIFSDKTRDKHELKNNVICIFKNKTNNNENTEYKKKIENLEKNIKNLNEKIINYEDKIEKINEKINNGIQHDHTIIKILEDTYKDNNTTQESTNPELANTDNDIKNQADTNLNNSNDMNFVQNIGNTKNIEKTLIWIINTYLINKENKENTITNKVVEIIEKQIDTEKIYEQTINRLYFKILEKEEELNSAIVWSVQKNFLEKQNKYNNLRNNIMNSIEEKININKITSDTTSRLFFKLLENEYSITNETINMVQNYLLEKEKNNNKIKNTIIDNISNIINKDTLRFNIQNKIIEEILKESVDIKNGISNNIENKLVDEEKNNNQIKNTIIKNIQNNIKYKEIQDAVLNKYYNYLLKFSNNITNQVIENTKKYFLQKEQINDLKEKIIFNINNKILLQDIFNEAVFKIFNKILLKEKQIIACINLDVEKYIIQNKYFDIKNQIIHLCIQDIDKQEIFNNVIVNVFNELMKKEKQIIKNVELILTKYVINNKI